MYSNAHIIVCNGSWSILNIFNTLIKGQTPGVLQKYHLQDLSLIQPFVPVNCIIYVLVWLLSFLVLYRVQLCTSSSSLTLDRSSNQWEIEQLNYIHIYFGWWWCFSWIQSNHSFIMPPCFSFSFLWMAAHFYDGNLRSLNKQHFPNKLIVTLKAPGTVLAAFIIS